ncbi:MAG: lipid export permease/ATP-binding protein MsbA [Pseudomonadota bacterium]|jgi:subfamily B ATP-binding cassette protein MsbA
MSSTFAQSRTLYLRLLAYVRPYWPAFVVALLCMAATAATEPVFPAIMKPLLDGNFGRGQGEHGVLFYPALVVLLFLVRGVVGFIADYSLAWVANNVVTDLRNAMFDRLVNLPTDYFADQSSGSLLSRVAYDVTGVTGAATGVITVLVRDTLTVAGLLALLVYLNWKLTLITFVMIPLVAVVVKLFSGRLRRMSRGQQQALGKISGVLEESIGAHRVVKLFGGQAHEKRRFLAATREQRGYAMRYSIAAGLITPITQLCAAFSLAVIIAVALDQSTRDQTTVGGFVSFITAMLMLLAPLKRLTDVNAPLQRGLAAAESVFALMDEPPERDEGRIDLPRARGEIRFEGVRFQYPGAARPALQDIDLTVAAGERLALVGTSGGGKTTLVNLIPRFFSPQAGRILIDGHDIADISLMSLRANIAMVSQDVVLFNDTLRANIAYGAMQGASEAAIIEAARAAHALDFINALPEGLDTLIGENGVKLSGGQRQRIAIARAILKDAPILILDEATSALDSESERHVQAALDTLMAARTTLIIAHRLSTIENADRIAVIAHGQVVETGPHAALIETGGMYAKLHSIQFSAS